MNINFGVGAQIVPFAQLIQEVAQEDKSNELEQIGNYVHTEDQKLLQGQPGSIVDLYG